MDPFKYITGSVMFFSILSLFVCIGLSIHSDTPSQMQRTLFEACLNTWRLGMGALFGLLGGKAMSSGKMPETANRKKRKVNIDQLVKTQDCHKMHRRHIK